MLNEIEHGDVIAAAVAASPAPAVQPRKFETETCGRCCGTGHYSYCQMYGTTCFGCSGSGKKMTKRGAAALAWFNERRSKQLNAFVIGDLFYNEPGPFNKGGFSKVIESAADMHNAGYWTVRTEAMGYSGGPAGMHKFGLTAAAKTALLAQAYDFQDSLTKQGTVRKRKGGK